VLACGGLAFGLIMLELVLVRLTSSLTLAVCAVTKELLLIAAAVLLYGDALTPTVRAQLSALRVSHGNSNFYGVFFVCMRARGRLRPRTAVPGPPGQNVLGFGVATAGVGLYKYQKRDTGVAC
jgi:hypothetical protein